VQEGLYILEYQNNGDNWQALITINKKKTYLGTFLTEKEGALVFDFYSILLHSLDARTNFFYTKQNICDMIENYKANKNALTPKFLLSVFNF
jgi:hypothetical protein